MRVNPYSPVTRTFPLVPDERETWENWPEMRAKNDGAGICNTGWGNEHNVVLICSLGEIGCNVDHTMILLDEVKRLRTRVMTLIDKP